MEQKYLSELHKEHDLWESELGFAKDEIETFKHRLEEVVQANTKTNVLAQAEHFQNQFIRHKEVIDTLVHDIHAAESIIRRSAEKNNVATDHRKADVNLKLVEEMESFTKIYKELKEEYKNYLVEVF